MKSVKSIALTTLLTALLGSVAAQVIPASGPSGSEARPAHEPPPQAYTDCVGKKAGDTVQHTTREGKVPATCEQSPKGLVARPKQPGGNAPAPTPK
jgi:hypothetical protein